MTQHGGTPLAGLNIRRAAGGTTELVPHLRKSALLRASFNWTPKVRRLLEQWDEVIPLMPLIEEAMVCLGEVEEISARIHMERSADDHDLILSAIASVGDQPGHPAVFSLPPREQDGEISWSTLPTAESVQAVVRHTSKAGPLEREARDDSRENLTPHQRGAAKPASAAIAALTSGDLAEHERIVQRILAEDNDVVPLISGPSDMAPLLLITCSTALGSTPEALLGAVTSERWALEGSLGSG